MMGSLGNGGVGRNVNEGAGGGGWDTVFRARLEKWEDLVDESLLLFILLNEMLDLLVDVVGGMVGRKGRMRRVVVWHWVLVGWLGVGLEVWWLVDGMGCL